VYMYVEGTKCHWDQTKLNCSWTVLNDILIVLENFIKISKINRLI